MHVQQQYRSQQDRQQWTDDQYSDNEDSTLHADCGTYSRANIKNATVNARNALAVIFKSLAFNELTFSLSDILKYSIGSIGILIILIYLFPNQLLLVLLAIIFMILCFVRALIDAYSQPQKIRDQPVNHSKLAYIRQKLLSEQNKQQQNLHNTPVSSPPSDSHQTLQH